MTTISIRNNPDRGRFEVFDGDAVIGRAAYVDDEDSRRIFYHTVIDEGYGGQGLAGRLAARALDETVAAGLMIVPVCPYIRSYLGRHSQYAANIKTPTPAILGFLDSALAARSRR